MPEIVNIQTESFDVEEAEDGVIIEGLALPFDKKSRNGVKYEEESVKQAAKTMEGNSLLFNHDETRPPIGHIEEFTHQDEGMHYRANLDPQEEKFIRKVNRGDIRNVSIQARVEADEADAETVKVLDFLELSLVPIAGFPQTDAEIMDMQTYAEKLKTEEEWICECLDCGFKLETDEHCTDIECPECGGEMRREERPGDGEKESEDKSKEPFGAWDDFEDCKQDMMDDGYDEDSAEKICGELQNQLESEDSNKREEEKSNDGDNMAEDKNEEQPDEPEPQEEEIEDEGEEEQKEQSEELAEKVEKLQETVQELSERVTSIEDQLAAEKEADDGDEDDEDDEEDEEENTEPSEEESMSKQVPEKAEVTNSNIFTEVRQNG